MKKVLSMLMGAVMLVSMLSVGIFAETIGPKDANSVGDDGIIGSTSGESINITVNGDIVHVYSVDITFSTTVFTFSTGSKWDPEQHIYVPSEEGSWIGDGVVTIANHSDLPVNYEVVATTDTNNFGDLELVVTDGTGTVAKSEVGDTDTDVIGRAGKITYTVEGTPTVAEINQQKLGTITVKISKVTDVDPEP